jgi:tripartite-type tricarboxylate transporter receptor subunit TctC
MKILSLAFGFAVCCQLAFAQSNYPTRPIRYVVPYPPAGPNDLLARSLNDPLGKRLGQSVVIDNRGGAATIIGAEIVANAPPDGYTLLHATVTTLAIAPLTTAKLPFHPERDFVPVSMLGAQPYMLAVHPAVPAQSLQQLIAHAKAHPGKLSYGSPGVGTSAHIAGEMLKHMAGINVVHVPYKGGGPAMNDLIAGQLAYVFGGVSGMLPHRQTGKIRVLANSSSKRSAAAPDIPTIAESGVPGFATSTWNALVAPRGTPQAIINRLNAEVNVVENQPEVRERLIKQGIDPEAGTQEQLRAHIRSEVVRYTALLKMIGLSNLQ